jgi:hypothetical protein
MWPNVDLETLSGPDPWFKQLVILFLPNYKSRLKAKSKTGPGIVNTSFKLHSGNRNSVVHSTYLLAKS